MSGDGVLTLSFVIWIPCFEPVSAGFLYELPKFTYELVEPEPWMYHWYGPAWFDQDHLSRNEESAYSFARPSQSNVPAETEPTRARRAVAETIVVQMRECR